MAGLAAAEVLRAKKIPAAALHLLGDDRLFRLAAAGDSRAFESIYARHHQALYRYCRSIVGNGEDAADALQSTMVSALRGLAGEKREIALKPWLFRIAHNECISLLRKRRAHSTIDDALELEAPPDDPAVRQRLQQLVADMRELPDAQRGALVMHELSGLRYRDIAAALDTTEPHARQLVYEARVALHDLAAGRVMECELVRRAISEADGRVMRGRRIRAHLRECGDCTGFDLLNRTRRRDLAAIAPPLPAALAAGLLHKVVGSSGGASAGAASGGAGGLGSMVAGKAAATSLVVKAAAVVAVAAGAGTGVVEVVSHSGTGNSHPASAPHSARAASEASHRSVPAPVRRPVTLTPATSDEKPATHHRHSHHHHRRPVRHRAKPAHPAHPSHPQHAHGPAAARPQPQTRHVQPAHPAPKPEPTPKPAKPVKPAPDAGAHEQGAQPKADLKEQAAPGGGPHA